MAYIRPSAHTLDHQEISGAIFVQIANTLRGSSHQVFIGSVDVRLPKADEADERIDTIVQPDVLVLCDEHKLDRRGVRGAPDFVVEVLSPATASHDQVLKRRVYERAGVREYWLVHPTDRLLTIYRLENGEYGKPDIRELIGATPITVLSGRVITWDEVVSRLFSQEW